MEVEVVKDTEGVQVKVLTGMSVFVDWWATVDIYLLKDDTTAGLTLGIEADKRRKREQDT